MKQNLIKLKQLREVQEASLKVLNDHKAEFEKQNLTLINTVASISEEVLSVEKEIRVQAVDLYNVNGEKKQDFGVGIRVLKKIDYDSDTAFAWAKSHELALTLDKKAFEKIAKIGDIDFVKITEEATATIPKKIGLVF